MEHRWNIRMPIKMGVEIYQRGQACAITIGRTRDLSGSGVCVEVDPATITENKVVDVRFVLRENVNDRSFQVPAMITHTYSDGLGLMFVNHDPEISERITELIQYHLAILAERQVRGFVDRYSIIGEQ